MAKKAYKVQGESISDCLNKAASKLNVALDSIDYEVVQYGKKGILGLGKKKYILRVSVKSDASRKTSKSQESLSAFDLELMGLEKDIAKLEGTDAVENEDRIFDEILSNYNDLDDELRKEIKQLSELGNDGTSRQVQEKISRDGIFSVTISEDNMKAFLSVSPPEGKGEPVTLKKVIDHLKDRDIVHGFDHVKIREVLDVCLKQDQRILNTEIAQGTLPTHGKNGSIRLLFETGGREEVVDKEGQFDYRGKAHIVNVKKDDPLARVIPTTEGIPGKNILGLPIPAKSGEPVRLDAGENVRFDSEKHEFYSEVDGVVQRTETMIHVKTLYVVNGDVDMETGNIEFEGGVKVQGYIRDGFSVTARDDIEVNGGVEGSVVVSKTGSVFVKEGVAGRGRCHISSAADFDAKYVEKGTVYATGNITIRGAVLHSKLVAGKSISVCKGKGMIAGGACKAGELVEAKIFGAQNEPQTNIMIGINMENQKEIEQYEQQASQIRQMLIKITKSIEKIVGKSMKADNLPARTRNEVTALKKKSVVLKYTEKKVLKKIEELEQQALEESQGRLKAFNTIHPHVHVMMGSAVYHVTNTMRAGMLVYDKEKMQILVKGLSE